MEDIILNVYFIDDIFKDEKDYNKYKEYTDKYIYKCKNIENNINTELNKMQLLYTEDEQYNILEMVKIEFNRYFKRIPLLFNIYRFSYDPEKYIIDISLKTRRN